MFHINKFYKQKQYEGDRLIDEKEGKCENKLRERWKDRDRYVYQYLQNNIMKYLMTIYYAALLT